MERVICENVENSYEGTGRGEGVSEIEYYPGRVLPDSEPGDVVILSPECEADFSVVARHYQQTGIAIAEEIHFTNDPTKLDLDSWPNHHLSPFLVNDVMAAWSGDHMLAQAVALADDKNWAIAMFRECGISHPDTACFDAGGIDTLGHFDGPLRFKPARGATNIGQEEVQDIHELHRMVPPGILQGRFQLQEPVRDVVAEGSVQSRIVDRKPQIIAVTGQYVNGDGHCGNYFPMVQVRDPKRLMREAMLFLRRLAYMGIRDYQSLDFLVDQNGDFYFTDPNIRRGGATSPTRVAERLGLRSWFNRLTVTAEATCKDLDLGTCSLVYTPERGEGIILTSAFTRKKKGVMLVCTPERLPYWQREAANWLQSAELKDARLVA